MNYGQPPQPIMHPTPTLRQIAERLAAQLAERAPPPPVTEKPADLTGQVVEKPYEEEAAAYEAAVIAQAKERGLKGTAYVLEQQAKDAELKKRIGQFYCKHQFVNVPVQWYGATVYPRICALCGKVRDSSA